MKCFDQPDFDFRLSIFCFFLEELGSLFCPNDVRRYSGTQNSQCSKKKLQPCLRNKESQKREWDCEWPAHFCKPLVAEGFYEFFDGRIFCHVKDRISPT